MTAAEHFVPTAEIRRAVSGRELEILSELGIACTDRSQHINCPYPTHPDKHPSWRWDPVKARAFCTCTRSDSIFDVIMKLREIGFEQAKVFAAQAIGRTDLVRPRGAPRHSRTDANSLLNPNPDNRDDNLPWVYLGRRLGIKPVNVPRPSTKVVGLKRLAYFDTPAQGGRKPFFVGEFPAAVFETFDRDDLRHAHRIYLSQDGLAKADLGLTPDGIARDAKKSARKIGNENTSGRSVFWGEPSKARTQVICEGIETAAAVAFAFQAEIGAGEFAVAACINAGGIEAFKPWSATARVFVAADRDDQPKNGRPPSRRGEIAAQRFANANCSNASVAIALPGRPGADMDWLDVLRRDGVDAVRAGILAAQPFSPGGAPTENQPQSESLDDADAAEIRRLAELPQLAYEREREPAAKNLKCRTSVLDELVKRARGETSTPAGQGRPIELPETTPWPEPVDGAILLGEMSSAIREYVVVTEEQADAIALDIVHTHAHDANDFSPIIILKSAQKRSGKSRLMQVLERMVARPLLVSGIRPAALLRLIELKAPTMLFDEVDAAMKQDRELNEAYRGIINSAFSRAGARFIMNVPLPGGGYEPRQFSTWAPLVLSGIGDLPDTIRDRSIQIDMVRKRKDEQVRRLRSSDGKELAALARKAARWAHDNFAKLVEAQPQMPQALNDRAADAWEPLFAIAALAGGEWPERARGAALNLSGETDEENPGTQLLADIRDVFTTEQMPSQVLVSQLLALEGSPWSECGPQGKPLTQNKLARLLKPYKVRPGTIRRGPGPEETAKGYRLSQFSDLFDRYLPGDETVTPSHGQKTGEFWTDEAVTTRSDVTDGKSKKSPHFEGCDAVTDGNPSSAEETYYDLAPEEETAI